MFVVVAVSVNLGEEVTVRFGVTVPTGVTVNVD
jgi:hypothetical protein